MNRRPIGAGVAAVIALVAVLAGPIAASADAGGTGCARGRTTACADVDLSRRDLRRWAFRGADLRGTDLSRSDLRGVDLRGARFDGANLSRADLRGADLRDASLAGTALPEADLRRARLDGARFSAARLRSADLRGVDYGVSFWTGADLSGSRGQDPPAVGRCDTVLASGAVAACALQLPVGDAAPTGRRPGGSPRVVVDLTRLVIRLVQRDRLNPPVASRVYAYTGAGLAQTVRPNSLALQGLAAVPAAPGPVDPEVVAASGAPLVPRGLTAVPTTQGAYAALRDRALAAAYDRGDRARFARSVDYGRGIATGLLAWAATDGFAATRDRPYTPTTGPGQWVPTPPTFQGAQEPYWGTLRPYAVTDPATCAPPPPPEYSMAAGSPYRREVETVHRIGTRLTADQKAIARFWADDRSKTGTPTGHWVATANLAIARRHLDLGHAAELQGLVGVAAGDAFIQAWATKYRYHQVRPITTIRAQLDPKWSTYLATPPFPDYVSGHATVSGAGAAVLTALAGSFPYLDRGFSTGSDVRAAFSVRPRHFRSFTAAAHEAARSRVYAGIHYPSSNAAGLELGECVATAALAARR